MSTEAKALPRAEAAERTILGSIMLDNSALFSVPLKPEHFGLDAHRKIFAAMMRLSDAGNPIELVTLVTELGNTKEIQAVGGMAYVQDLTTGVIPGRKLDYFIEEVHQAAAKRYLINTFDVASVMAASSEPVEECLRTLEDAILRVQANNSRKATYPVSQIAPEVIDELAIVRDRLEEVIGFTTGIPSLDRATTGIRSDEYWVIGALPSRGKTMLGIQIAAENAKRGVPVLFFSHEMTRRQLVKRILPGEAGVDAFRLRDPRFLSHSEWDRLKATAKDVASWPLWVCDPEEMTARELTATAKLYIRRHGIKLIIVDYLQLLEAPGKELRERVSAASNALRTIPKRENVPVVALSQLARPRDRNENGRPSMIDLKESGAIEAHAHTVLLIYRPKDSVGAWTGEDEIIIAKQREGLAGHEKVTLHTDRLRFVGRVDA